jgi:nucleotide-binding universal stress UspA family protein
LIGHEANQGGDDQALPLIQNARLQAEKELTRVRQLEFMDGVECETEVRTGSTIDEICAASGQPDIDLLVTSTHGYTGFSHAMIGSIAEHIVRYAESPVLVVPARSHE